MYGCIYIYIEYIQLLSINIGLQSDNQTILICSWFRYTVMDLRPQSTKFQKYGFKPEESCVLNIMYI